MRNAALADMAMKMDRALHRWGKYVGNSPVLKPNHPSYIDVTPKGTIHAKKTKFVFSGKDVNGNPVEKSIDLDAYWRNPERTNGKDQTVIFMTFDGNYKSKSTINVYNTKEGRKPYIFRAFQNRRNA